MIRRILRRTAAVLLSAALCIPPLPSHAASSSVPIEKQHIISILSELQGVMDRSYENSKEDVRRLASEGYDFELTMSSLENHGKPYSEFDYREFLAAYATIKANRKDIGEGINEIDFINFIYTPRTVEEYVPVRMYRYTEDRNGLYVRSGIYFIGEPVEVDDYKLTSDGIHYRKSGKKKIEPETVVTKYADVTLSMISMEQLYETFGLDRDDYIEEEEERRKKIDAIMKEADLVQSVVYAFSVPEDGYESQIINMGLALTDNPLRKFLLQIASSARGRFPYLWGGKSAMAGMDPSWYTFNSSGKQNGLDCSGYTQWVLRTAGYSGWRDLGWTGFYLDSPLLDRITQDELMPGDFGLRNSSADMGINHVGIYVGNGYWIHCSSSLNGVVVSENSSLHFTTFRRIKGIDSAMLPGHEKVYENDASPVIQETEAAIETEAAVIGGKGKNRKKEEEQAKEPEIPALADFTEMISNMTSSHGSVVTASKQETPEKEKKESPGSGKIVAGGDNIGGESIDEIGLFDPIEDPDIMFMAKIVQLEAHGEGYNGWVAVAEVIRNRIISRMADFRDQHSVMDVVSAPKQFATYNAALSMSDDEVDPRLLEVCKKVMDGSLSYFMRDDIIGFRTVRPMPDDLTFCGWPRYEQLGNHSFYKEPDAVG